ncbi:MAG: aminopeptidase N [Deltaproteobacteria bacterium]|nr:MAG: aminopeptidase N [Deltaproteobacteria bacterium]
MKDKQPVVIYRKDYQPFPFEVDTIDLRFELFEDKTWVTSVVNYRQNPRCQKTDPGLRLDGEGLELISIELDDIILDDEAYALDEKGLLIFSVPDAFRLTIRTIIYPDKNTSLEGLYRSNGNFCSQCEAEGFRKITYYPDRPDVLARFTTRIEADKTLCPVLLSNGNPLQQGELEDNRHYAVWEDPFAKPCYLFALVAGQLVDVRGTYTTASGREVDLRIYVEEKNRHKCGHALLSLQKAMRWDEEVFGLEYDLDTFMIVAVDDFNMGAMENKGLNIFNSKYVLCTPETATDADYLGIEGVIAHEYFHNWTGNRVTCRDWFQLSLKEGLTVFRDQEFSSDMNSRPVQRIKDVRLLQNVQFREDSGPMAHPIRPDSFVEISNFYTSTVYNKGAEVIRMLHTLLGARRFREGMDLYFQRHDGCAVTCEDFVKAMEDASKIDLAQFRNWYRQAGTPVLTVTDHWDSETKEYQIKIKQSCRPTPGQEKKAPFHIPVKVGLLGSKGQDLLCSSDVTTPGPVLELKEPEESFSFQGIAERPVLSFLRDFSAPVKVESFQSAEDLAWMMALDSNLYNRWYAANQLSTGVILALADQLRKGLQPEVAPLYLEAIQHILDTEIEDMELTALALTLPQETVVAQEMEVIYPQFLHQARILTKQAIAGRCRQQFYELYHRLNTDSAFSISAAARGRRSLKNVCLAYLMAAADDNEELRALCLEQYFAADNMTDSIAALSLLAHFPGKEQELAVADFYQRWQEDSLVVDKWFALQAMSEAETALETVKRLMEHRKFSITNPNKVRALIGAFCSGNHARFHEADGSGYAFLTEQILRLNTLNPQIAARLLSPMTNWRRYQSPQKDLMKGHLHDLQKRQDLSRDLFEIVKNSLA